MRVRVLTMLGAGAMVLSSSCQVGPSEARAATARALVVVELFSSEGCSSCPPADLALARLARDQPVAGAEVIALEMHVDYWDSLGWKDPFSSSTYTARQQAYARVFAQRGSYTPQAVVDGAAEGIGSNESALRSMIATAAREPKAKIQLSVVSGQAKLIVTGLDPAVDDADLFLAITEEGLATDVPRGENGGSRLEHGPVVRSLSSLGPVRPGATETRQAPVVTRPEWRRDKLRVVGFLERRGTMRIVGAGAAPI